MRSQADEAALNYLAMELGMPNPHLASLKKALSMETNPAGALEGAPAFTGARLEMIREEDDIERGNAVAQDTRPPRPMSASTSRLKGRKLAPIGSRFGP